jgi:hypothetical protein
MYMFNHHIVFWVLTIGAAWTSAIVAFALARITPRIAYRTGVARGRYMERRERADRIRAAMTVDVPNVAPKAVEGSGVWS